MSVEAKASPESLHAPEEVRSDFVAHSGPLRCSLLQSTVELEAFAAVWADLWQSDREATPFQHPAWLLPWWHQFGDGYRGRELRCVVIRGNGPPGASSAVEPGGDVLALLPFYRYADPATGEHTLLLLGTATSDYLDGIFASSSFEERCEHAQAGLLFLLSHAGWDVLHAAQLRAESPLRAALELFAPAAGSQNDSFPYLIERWAAEPTSHVLATPISEFFPKLRRNAVYYRTRAERLGELTLRAATEEDCLAVFDELVGLHTARWQAVGQAGVLADPPVLEHHRAALPALARAGLLRLMTLRVGDETLGVLYSLIDPVRENFSPQPPSFEMNRDLSGEPSGRGWERRQYFYLTAFAPAYAELSPGTLLVALAIEQAAREGVALADFLRGGEAYKQLWHAEPTATFGFTLRRG